MKTDKAKELMQNLLMSFFLFIFLAACLELIAGAGLLKTPLFYFSEYGWQNCANCSEQIDVDYGRGASLVNITYYA
ncbi:MAG: hypothetical protein HGA85_04900, partial [Nanoarchaeota archaeon]|nr:hypothetical protein [Nanoarchaeota archaeon]